jgi:HD-GYP domain-containing protein (c-di-GMP phosphodiesterase class II)
MILKTKLISLIVLVILLTVGVSTVVVLNFQQRHLTEAELMDIRLLSNIISRSIESAMAEGRTEDVQKIIENIGKNPELLKLRIISPDGFILKSKDPQEIGQKSTEAGSLGEFNQAVVKEASITYRSPIYNKPACYGCHSKNIRLNGIIEMSYDFSRSRADILATKRFLVLSNIFTIVAVGLLLSVLLTRQVIRPLSGMLKAIKRLQQGDWNARAPVFSDDELGHISQAFNQMVEEVKKLYETGLRKEKEIVRARAELEHKRTLEELNAQLKFKIKEVETANKAILSLSKELKNKNLELERMVERLKKINDVGRVLTSVIETEELIKLIIKTTAELLSVEKGSIYLKKGDDVRLTIQYQRGVGVDYSTVSLDFHPMYKKLLSEGTVVKSFTNGTSSVGIPLKVKGQVIGGMLLEKVDSPFSQDELEILSTLANQAMVAIENAWLYDSVKANYFGTIQALVNALEANDKYTRGHSERVRYVAVELGKHLGLNYKELEVLEHAAILHDIGKIGVDSMVLNKMGKLSAAELSLVKAHPLIGDEILGPIGTLEGVRGAILQHHERYDGSGYPYGLAGEEISLKARILAVADTFDAMMTDRPYRKALGLATTKEELRRNAGTQFDPLVVDAFLQILETRGEEFLQAAGYSTN